MKRSFAVAVIAGLAALGAVTLPAAPALAAEIVTPVAPTVVEAECAPDGRSSTKDPELTLATTAGIDYWVDGGITAGSTVWVSARATDGFELPEIPPQGWDVQIDGELAMMTVSFEYCFHRTGELVLPVITNATETCVAGEKGAILPPAFEMPAIENANPWVTFYDEEGNELESPVVGGSVEVWLSPDAFFQFPRIIPAEWVDEGDAHVFTGVFGFDTVECAPVTPEIPTTDNPADTPTDTPADTPDEEATVVPAVQAGPQPAAQTKALATTGSAPMTGLFAGLGALLLAGGASLMAVRGVQRRRAA